MSGIRQRQWRARLRFLSLCASWRFVSEQPWLCNSMARRNQRPGAGPAPATGRPCTRPSPAPPLASTQAVARPCLSLARTLLTHACPAAPPPFLPPPLRLPQSTLMRAIANGQVDGFPPKDVLRTVYVEHDIDGSLSDMNSVEFVFADAELQAAVPTTLAEVGRAGVGGWGGHRRRRGRNEGGGGGGCCLSERVPRAGGRRRASKPAAAPAAAAAVWLACDGGLGTAPTRVWECAVWH